MIDPRIRRLIRGMARLSKYPAVLSLAVTLGCHPDPQLITVSRDGRYVAFPIDAEGRVPYGENAAGAAQTAVIDLQTMTCRLIDLTLDEAIDDKGSPADVEAEGAAVMWLSIGGDRVAMQVGNEHVMVFGPAGMLLNVEGITGSLSPDGKLLALGKDGNPKADDDAGLWMIQIDTGQRTRIASMGFAGVFSNDGKQLAYIGATADADHDNDELPYVRIDDNHSFHLYVYDIDAGTTREMMNVGLVSSDKYCVLPAPTWAGTDQLLVNTPVEKDDDTGEVMLVHLDGRSERLTSNSGQERNAHMTADGRVFYQQTDGDQPPVLMVATRDGDTWTHERVNQRGVLPNVAGNHLLWIAMDDDGDERHAGRVMLRDADTGEVRDLSALTQAAAN